MSPRRDIAETVATPGFAAHFGEVALRAKTELKMEEKMMNKLNDTDEYILTLERKPFMACISKFEEAIQDGIKSGIRLGGAIHDG